MSTIATIGLPPSEFFDGDFVKCFALEKFNSVLYSTTHDIQVISSSILVYLENLPDPRNREFIVQQLSLAFIKCRESKISKRAEKSLGVFIRSIKIMSEKLDDVNGAWLLQSNLCQLLRSAAYRNIKLDDDGKKQLCRDRRQEIYQCGIRSNYLENNFPTSLQRDEAYAIEMKIRFHDLQKDRNENLLPQHDASILKKLFARDLNLLNAFPNLLLQIKQAILIAIAHFQSKPIDDRDLYLDLSNLDDQQKNDGDIFLAAAKSPKTASIIGFASDKLKKNESFYQRLVQKRGSLLAFADEALRDRVTLVRLAVQNDPSAIAFAGPSAVENSEVIVALAQTLIENRSDALQQQSI